MSEAKVYLGDGVYAEFSDYDVRLSTARSILEGGVFHEVTHEIFLEDNMIELLYNMLKRRGSAQ
jgi:hypothetical protein